mgnify:CR=1 FL=1
MSFNSLSPDDMNDTPVVVKLQKLKSFTRVANALNTQREFIDTFTNPETPDDIINELFIGWIVFDVNTITSL